MSERTIYDALIDAGLTPEGACGLMGNMKAESSMKANIAQRGMTKLTDEQYTRSFDQNPSLHERDSVGFGLCQWTFWSRKQNLWKFAKSWGVSVGDEAMQVQFCLHELREEYSKLLSFLCETHDLMAAAERVCKEYERPAVNNVATRYGFAEEFFERFASPMTETVDYPPDPSIMMLQTILVYNGYSEIEVTGYKDADTLDALQDFVTALRG